MKKLSVGKKGVILSMAMMLLMTACSSGNGGTENGGAENGGADNGASSSGNTINVITREEGSGTRSAFVEITGILEKNDAGEEVDNTYIEAVVQNSTEAVLSSVANDVDAIGYISLGSLNDTVKPVKVEGVEPTAENIKSGDYKIQRPFNIVYNEDISDGVKDFLAFIASDDGQAIVEAEGYIAEFSGETYATSDNQEAITIAGSTSVTPLMEKLVEAYTKFNPLFKADIQATGSSAGVKSAQDKTAEIGMVSRELKDSEQNLQYAVIARDGIVIISNKDSAFDDMSMDDIKAVFTGEKTTWE